MIYRLKKNS